MSTCDSSNMGGPAKVKLKKGINLFTGCCIIIGNMIGSGIFISSQTVMENTRSQGVALVVWVLCGCLSLVGTYHIKSVINFIQSKREFLLLIPL
jgi:hypothetical protein